MEERFQDLDEELLDGVDAIRRYIDPRMAWETYYRYWKPLLRSVMMERPNFNKHHRKRYFTYKRLVLAVMLEVLEPGTISHKWRREDRVKAGKGKG